MTTPLTSLSRVCSLMRYGIFSDVHSNLEALEAVIKAYKKESIDEYLCVGDIVGYAANPKECIEKVQTLVAATAAGNHDWGSTGKFPADYFNPEAKTAVIWSGQQLNAKDKFYLDSLDLVYKNKDLTLVHATLQNPENFDYMLEDYQAAASLRIQETQACFLGHSHTPGVFVNDKDNNLSYTIKSKIRLEPDKQYIVNVGSVGQPRDGDRRASYCIFDTEKHTVEIKRAGYNIKAVQDKIKKAGLPLFLAERLAVGR